MVCYHRSWFYLASVTKQTLFEHFLSGLRADFWDMLRKMTVLLEDRQIPRGQKKQIMKQENEYYHSYFMLYIYST